MRISIETIRGRSIKALLRENGWRLDETSSGRYHAKHPAAKDQATVRAKLNELGLLTSNGVRIEIDPMAN